MADNGKGCTVARPFPWHAPSPQLDPYLLLHSQEGQTLLQLLNTFNLPHIQCGCGHGSHVQGCGSTRWHSGRLYLCEHQPDQHRDHPSVSGVRQRQAGVVVLRTVTRCLQPDVLHRQRAHGLAVGGVHPRRAAASRVAVCAVHRHSDGAAHVRAVAAWCGAGAAARCHAAVLAEQCSGACAGWCSSSAVGDCRARGWRRLPNRDAGRGRRHGSDRRPIRRRHRCRGGGYRRRR